MVAIDESTYSKSIKPAPAGDEAEVEIMVNVTIFDISSIDELNSGYQVQFGLCLEWKDRR